MKASIARSAQLMPRVVRNLIMDTGLMGAFQKIARQHGATVDQVISRSSQRHLTKARVQMYWHLYYNVGWSLPTIGDLFGRGHESVLRALQAERHRRDGRLPKIEIVEDGSGRRKRKSRFAGGLTGEYSEELGTYVRLQGRPKAAIQT